MRPRVNWVLLGLVGAVMGLSLGLGGCGEEAPPPPPPPPPVAEVPAEPQLVKDASAEVTTYFYSPVGKRDPFRSFYKVEAKPDEKGPGGILTNFEIDQLRLIAIVSGLASPRAQVELPGGKGVNIKVGTRVGKNYGRVVRIRNDEVIIAEDYRDPVGRKVTNLIHMKIFKRVENK